MRGVHRSVESRGTRTFYFVTALVMWVLSLGPRPTLYGAPIGVPGPYALLMGLPGFNGMRVPARLWMVSVLCLAVARGVRRRRIEAAARAAGSSPRWPQPGCSLDGWPRAFPLVAAPGMRITSTTARARLGLPLRENETETMYGAIAQARPVFNGYSGYEAPQHFAMRDLLEQHDPRILGRLAAAETIEVVIEPARRRRRVERLRRGPGGGKTRGRDAGLDELRDAGRPVPSRLFHRRRRGWPSPQSRPPRIRATSTRSSTTTSTRGGTRSRSAAARPSRSISGGRSASARSCCAWARTRRSIRAR